jgi:hypothetical protein
MDTRQTQPKIESLSQVEPLIAEAIAPVKWGRKQIDDYAARLEATIAAKDYSDVGAIARAIQELPTVKELQLDHPPYKDAGREDHLAAAALLKHQAEIMPLLEAELASRSKSKASGIAGFAKLIGDLTAKVWTASPADKEKVKTELEAREREAADFAATFEIAEASIRHFRVNPTVATWRETAARISEVSSGSAGSSAA